MYRHALEYLKEWKVKSNRKPLVLRGARQVGKSYLIRLFSEEQFENLLEINLEKNQNIAELFVSKSADKIIQLLELQFNADIVPGKTLLFLDEIQAAPDVFAALRYFHEEKPELHVIAAGSLLEFMLGEHSFSMPVGRIEYMHLGPMQFEEFILASGKKKLSEFIANFSLDDPIPTIIHNQLLGLLKEFLAIGGMPEAIDTYLKTGSMRKTDEVKQSILSTYKDDFSKYRKRINYQLLQNLFNKIPLLVGQKFKYVNVDGNERADNIARSLDMLRLARIVYPVYHTSGTGIPLGATVDFKKFKVLFLDVGLMSTATGLNLVDFEQAKDIISINSGAIAEQFVGQHLLYSQPGYKEPELYYWMREKKNTSAEIDYLISEGNSIIPIEVKAGKSGTLKSLHLFLKERQKDFAIRLNSDQPSLLTAGTTVNDGQDNIPYTLLSLPLYLVGQVRRLAKGKLG